MNTMNTSSEVVDPESVVSIWRCDVCFEAVFDTYDEAVEHESQCCRPSSRGGARDPFLSEATVVTNTVSSNSVATMTTTAAAMPTSITLPPFLELQQRNNCIGGAGGIRGATCGPMPPTRPVPEFLCHLYSMLSDPAVANVMSWIVPSQDQTADMGGGKAGVGKVVVHDPTRLQNEVLGRYYRHSEYPSFQRQMNYFGFKKRLHGRGKKGTFNPCSYVHDTLGTYPQSLLNLKRRTVERKDQPQPQQEDNHEAADVIFATTLKRDISQLSESGSTGESNDEPKKKRKPEKTPKLGAEEAESLKHNKRNKTSKAGLPLGITLNSSTKKWTAQLSYAGRSRYIGQFASKLDAAMAYEKARECRGSLKNDTNPTPEQVQQNIVMMRMVARSFVQNNTEKQNTHGSLILTNPAIEGDTTSGLAQQSPKLKRKNPTQTHTAGSQSKPKVAKASDQFRLTASNRDAVAHIPVAFGFLLDDGGASLRLANTAGEKWIKLGEKASKMEGFNHGQGSDSNSFDAVTQGLPKGDQKTKTRILRSKTNPLLEPAGSEFPVGWTSQTYTRKKPTLGKTPTYKVFTSPLINAKFRSKKGALIFIEILKESGIDGENMAFDAFKSRGHKL